MRIKKKLKGVIVALICTTMIAGCSFQSDDLMGGITDSISIDQQMINGVKETPSGETVVPLEQKISEDISEGISSAFNSFVQDMIPVDVYPDSNNSASGTSPKPSSGTLEIHYIDVGQGDCTLIKNIDAEGKESYMLIDAGDNSMGTKVQNYLSKQGISKLELMIVTHADADHEGGADVIITKFDVANVWIPNQPKETTTHRDVLDAMKHKGIKATEPSVGDVYYLGDTSITVIGPVDNYENTNSTSICVKIVKGNTSFLFCGDAEEEAELDMVTAGADLSANVYHVNHHGSKTSSTEQYLKAVNPTWAVISCGENNDYWHPHGSTLNTLRKFGILVYRTDEQGTIIATSDGNDITWNASPSDTWLAGTGPNE